MAARVRVEERAAMVDRPGAILRLLYWPLFRTIEFPDDAAARIRAAAARGPVVYVLPSVSYVAYLYFGYALRRLGLPLARFANGGVRTILLLPLFVAMQIGLAIWRLARGARLEPEEDTFTRFVDAGQATLLFLRPATRLIEEPDDAARVRGHFMESLIALERRRAAAGAPPIQLVPMTLVLGRPAVRQASPRGQGVGAWSTLFGEPEAPGRLRATFQFLWHRKDSEVKVAEPIELGAFLRAAGERSDEALARMLRFELSGAIERERRVLMGPPVKSARRVRKDVLRSRSLVQVVDKLAAEPGAPPRQELVRRAERDLKKIAAFPRAWPFRILRVLLGFVFERMYEGIDVDEAGIERLREAAKRGPLLLLPSHKSHVDYLILSYAFYERGLVPPHIAAGENLSFFPLGFIFRRCGAFFLRRSFRGDALYAAVFDAYMRRLLRDGFSMEFFIEGGRSRTGKVLPPKYGLLSTCADAALDGEAPAAQVVPIAISYEKVVEEKDYQKELAGGAKKKEGLGSLVRAGRVLRSRYGRIDLQFAEPFPLLDALREGGAAEGADAAARRRAVQRLAHRVTWEIAQTTAVMPSALLAAAALATDGRGVPRRELERRARALLLRAHEGGARFSATLVEDSAAALERTLARLASDGDLDLRGHGDDEVVVVPLERRPRLEFYKNNLIHALADLSIVARAALAAGADAAEADVRSRAQAASRVLKRELVFRPGKGFPRAFAEALAWLERLGLVRLADGRVAVTDAGRSELPIYAGLTGSYLDAYAVAVRAALAAEPKTLKDKKQFPAKAHALGDKLLLLGEITRSEAVSRPYFETAWDSFKDVGALDSSDALAQLERDLAAVRFAPVAGVSTTAPLPRPPTAERARA